MHCVCTACALRAHCVCTVLSRVLHHTTPTPCTSCAGFSLAHGSPVRGSRTLDWFMQRHSDLDEATVCPNSRDARMWYPCKDLATCAAAETAMFAKSAHKVLAASTTYGCSLHEIRLQPL